MTSLLPTTPPRKDLGYFYAFPEGLLLRFPRGATSSLSQRGYFFAFPEGLLLRFPRGTTSSLSQRGPVPACRAKSE